MGLTNLRHSPRLLVKCAEKGDSSPKSPQEVQLMSGLKKCQRARDISIRQKRLSYHQRHIGVHL